MKQSELIAAVSDVCVLPKVQVEMVLKGLADVASVRLAEDDPEIPLPGLGKLTITTRAARIGRNPATGAEIQIPEKRTVVFKAGQALKNAVA